MTHFPAIGSGDNGVRAPRMYSVLVVDDEPLQVDTIMRLLKREKRIGIRASASRAELALAMFDRGVRFDQIVTDYHMDGMTGAELAIELRRRGIETPVILCSAAARPQEIADSGAEFASFIRKGGDEYAAALLASIREQLSLDEG